MFEFIVGTACLLFILMVAGDIVLLLLLIALFLAVVGAIVGAFMAWPELAIWLGGMVTFLGLCLAYFSAQEALNKRFPHSLSYYAGLLYARLTK